MILSNIKRIVVKVGSSLIIDSNNVVRKSWLDTMASDIADLKRSGKEVIIVTSGAVALGRPYLKYGDRRLDLEEKQAAAACGQITLFTLWGQALSGHAFYPAQLLMTADDSIDRRRYLNARNTIDTLLKNDNVIPIINENDTLATAELRFGDNDRLAARVAQMAGADVLILLSDIDGLYSANPATHRDAEFIAEVHEITQDIEAMAGGAASTRSSGGMITKIAAAKITNQAGCHMVIARGTIDHPLKALQNGGKHTHFIANENPLSARKHWIAGSIHPAGSVIVDDGAARALKKGNSLLPAGVTGIEGEFNRGDAVVICNKKGDMLGKGLIAYNAEDAQRIIGKQSSEIEDILGFKGRDVLIHRDDMVLEQ